MAVHKLVRPTAATHALPRPGVLRMSTDEYSTTRLSEDEWLLRQRLREGDRSAVAAIERRFGDELRLVCRRMLNDGPLAEDVVQDVLATCCTLAAGAATPPSGPGLSRGALAARVSTSRACRQASHNSILVATAASSRRISDKPPSA